MSFVTAPFQAFLAAPIASTDISLPLSQMAHADLVHLLCDDDVYTFLSIRDEVNFETVKAYMSCGELFIDRGQGGTTPVKFSFGACVSTLTPTAIAVLNAVLKERLDDCMNYFNPDAMGGTLSVSFTDLSTADANKAWRGMLVVAGTIPVQMKVSGLPTWVTAVQQSNMLELTGTPPRPSSSPLTSTFTLNAKNAQEGTEITQQFNIVVR